MMELIDNVNKTLKDDLLVEVKEDSCMANDSVATNFDQIFATYSPSTVRKVL